MPCATVPQSSKTPRYVRGFVVFVSLVICKLGVDVVSRTMDAVQPKIMLMILQNVSRARLTIGQGQCPCGMGAVLLYMSRALMEGPCRQFFQSCH